MRIVVILALTLLAGPAVAGTVFSCKDAKGATTFQHTPCAGVEQKMHRFKREADNPAHVAAEAAAVSRNRGQPLATQGQQELDQHAATPLPAGDASYSLCAAADVTWVQPGWCPPTMAKRVFMACSGTTDRGAFMTGTCSQMEDIAVQSRALSHSDFCSALSAGQATSSKKPKSSSDAAYERNVLRQREGC